jgi:hypothetical protein
MSNKELVLQEKGNNTTNTGKILNFRCRDISDEQLAEMVKNEEIPADVGGGAMKGAALARRMLATPMTVQRASDMMYRCETDYKELSIFRIFRDSNLKPVIHQENDDCNNS